MLIPITSDCGNPNPDLSLTPVLPIRSNLIQSLYITFLSNSMDFYFNIMETYYIAALSYLQIMALNTAFLHHNTLVYCTEALISGLPKKNKSQFKIT